MLHLNTLKYNTRFLLPGSVLNGFYEAVAILLFSLQKKQILTCSCRKHGESSNRQESLYLDTSDRVCYIISVDLLPQSSLVVSSCRHGHYFK